MIPNTLLPGQIIAPMQTLRNARQIARLVLVWFALSIGVAIASPLVEQHDILQLCSAVAHVAANGSPDSPVPAGHSTLDCPLCAGISAPPPLHVDLFTEPAPLFFAAPVRSHHLVQLEIAGPPPARGTPSIA